MEKHKWDTLFWLGIVTLIFGSCTINDALSRRYGAERFSACIAAIKDVAACEKVR